MSYRPLTELPESLSDSNGAPLSGGVLYAYLSGTSTATPLYADAAGTPLGTSITLDARGEVTTVKRAWINTALNYKLVLKDSAGVTIWTIDPVYGVPQGDAGLQTVTPPGGTTAVALRNSIELTLAHFGGVCDRETDDAAALQAAIDYFNTLATPLVNGQGLIPRLIIPGPAYIGSSVDVDRVEGGQTCWFRIIPGGPNAGFVVPAGVTLFDTSLAGNTEITKSTMIRCQNLIFQGSESGALSYVMAAGKFVRVAFEYPDFRQIQLCNVTGAAGTGNDYIQSISILGGSVREARGDFMTTVDAFDIDICGLRGESNNGDLIAASGRIAGARIGGIWQSNTGSLINAVTWEGVMIMGVYAENNTAPLVQGSNVSGSCAYGVNVTSSTANLANSSHWEFMFDEVTGFSADGIQGNGRLFYSPPSATSANIAIGGGVNAGISVCNRDFKRIIYGQQNISAEGLQRVQGVYRNIIELTDFRTTSSGTTAFASITPGAGPAVITIDVLCCGIRPGSDYIAVKKTFVCTRAAGAFTINSVDPFDSGSAGAITCTEAAGVLNLNYVFAGASDNTFITTVKVHGVAGETGRTGITAAIL